MKMLVIVLTLFITTPSFARNASSDLIRVGDQVFRVATLESLNILFEQFCATSADALCVSNHAYLRQRCTYLRGLLEGLQSGTSPLAYLDLRFEAQMVNEFQDQITRFVETSGREVKPE